MRRRGAIAFLILTGLEDVNHMDQAEENLTAKVVDSHMAKAADNHMDRAADSHTAKAADGHMAKAVV